MDIGRGIGLKLHFIALSGWFTMWGSPVGQPGMGGGEEWKRVIPVDTTGDVHVASRADGVHVFYTERPEAFIRSDTVVALSECR